MHSCDLITCKKTCFMLHLSRHGQVYLNGGGASISSAVRLYMKPCLISESVVSKLWVQVQKSRTTEVRDGSSTVDIMDGSLHYCHRVWLEPRRIRSALWKQGVRSRSAEFISFRKYFRDGEDAFRPPPIWPGKHRKVGIWWKIGHLYYTQLFIIKWVKEYGTYDIMLYVSREWLTIYNVLDLLSWSHDHFYWIRCRHAVYKSSSKGYENPIYIGIYPIREIRSCIMLITQVQYSRTPQAAINTSLPCYQRSTYSKGD